LGSPSDLQGWILLGERRDLYPYFDEERRYLRLVGELLGSTVKALRAAERVDMARPIASDDDSEELRLAKERLARAQRELASTRRAEREIRERLDPELLGDVLGLTDELANHNPQMALNVLRRLHAAYDYLLSPAEGLTTLEQEMKFAQDYLALEKLRLRNRLDVQLSYDSSLALQAVPRRILQPLIENALRHGLAQQLRSGSIIIHADGNGLCELTIEDNGRGFPEGFVLDDAPGEGGLARLRRSLRERYGESAGVEVDDTVAEGAKLTVRFPRRDLKGVLQAAES
jgi:LytS/YehU family sensor histidine kinase